MSRDVGTKEYEILQKMHINSVNSHKKITRINKGLLATLGQMQNQIKIYLNELNILIRRKEVALSLAKGTKNINQAIILEAEIKTLNDVHKSVVRMSLPVLRDNF